MRSATLSSRWKPRLEAALPRRPPDGSEYEDVFCLATDGIRVGYASPTLLATLSTRERTQLKGRVIWASTANRRHALRGIRAGMSVTAARKHLKLAPAIQIGTNRWYLAADGSATAILKTRGGSVEEIGIATRQVTRGRSARRRLLTSFS